MKGAAVTAMLALLALACGSTGGGGTGRVVTDINPNLPVEETPTYPQEPRAPLSGPPQEADGDDASYRDGTDAAFDENEASDGTPGNTTDAKAD